MSEQRRVLGADEVEALIAEHIEAYRRGGANRRDEDVRLAMEVGIPPGGVREDWAEAAVASVGNDLERAIDAALTEDAEAKAFFKKPAENKTGSKVVGPGEAKELLALPSKELEEEFKRRGLRRLNAEGGEAWPDEDAGEKPKDKTKAGPIILRADAPYETAGIYVQKQCLWNGLLTLHRWKGDFWQWDGAVYRKVSNEEVNHWLWEWLDDAKRRSRGDDGYVGFRPVPKNVEDLLKALKGGVFLPEAAEPPVWLERVEGAGMRIGDQARGMIAFKNGLVDIATGEFVKHTPRLWNHDVLDFDYVEGAECPRWLRWLGEVLPEDVVSQNLLEEFGGYCMTWETKFQKALMLHGEPRAGKGTYAWLMEKMVGSTAYTPLNINTWVAGENSTADVVGKKVLCFPDVRLRKEEEFGEGNWKPFGLDQRSVTMMLMLIAADKVSIGMKWDKFKWKGRVEGKIIYITNEIPNFNDTSGALPERYLGAHFPVNFEKAGRKDPDLKEKLRPELPGIANRLMEGYRRVMRRGEFVEAASGAVIRQKIGAKTTPEQTFFDTYFEFGGDEALTLKWLFWPLWQYWAGKMELPERVTAGITTASQLSRALGQRVGGWTGLDFRPHGGDAYYRGIRLKALDAEALAHLAQVAKDREKDWPVVP